MIIKTDDGHHSILQKCCCDNSSCENWLIIGNGMETTNRRYMVTILPDEDGLGKTVWLTRDNIIALVKDLFDILDIEE